MGTVHSAVVQGDVPGLVPGTRVALKILHPHLGAHAGNLRRFLREARAGMAVRQENVVRTLDAGEGMLAEHPLYRAVIGPPSSSSGGAAGTA
jgi:hypothetical protein